MTLASSRYVIAVRRRLRTTLGKRFSRFALVAVAAVASTQITATLLLGVAHVSAGLSGALAAMVGAAVSYVLSRWAWERKGRPDLLRETLPFWAVSVVVWIVLGLTAHFASLWATSMGLDHWERVAFVDGAIFLANCVTFVGRFLLFHYVLFADRGAKVLPSATIDALELDPEPSHTDSIPDGTPELTRVNGRAGGNGSGSHRASRSGSATSTSGTRTNGSPANGTGARDYNFGSASGGNGSASGGNGSASGGNGSAARGNGSAASEYGSAASDYGSAASDYGSAPNGHGPAVNGYGPPANGGRHQRP